MAGRRGRRIAVALALSLILGPAAAAETDPVDDRLWGPTASFGLGMRYDSAAARERERRPRGEGPVIAGEGYLFTENEIAGLRLQTSAELYADSFLDDHDDDFYQVSAWTGPRLARIGVWTLRSAFGGRVSYYGGRRYGLIGDGYLILENFENEVLRYLELGAGYADYGADAETGSGGPWGSFRMELHAPSPPIGDTLRLVPGMAHYHSGRKRLRYTELGVTLGWGTPLPGPLRLDVEAYTSYSRFDGSDPGDPEAGVEPAVSDGIREDWYTFAYAGLSIHPLFSSLLTLEFRYSYENNESNDRSERFDSHSGGAYLTLAF